MIFYEYVHSAYEKLKKGEEITEEEREELVKVLDKAMGVTIPTPEELRGYKQNVDDVKTFGKSNRTVDRVPPLLKKMEEYDNKYHEGE